MLPICPRPRTCPACGAAQLLSHGSFRRKDGSRERRYRCRHCDKTCSARTGTALAYIKKPHLWQGMARCLLRGLTLRHSAEILQVTLETAFSWRHRLLGALATRPQPRFAGAVGVMVALVPYADPDIAQRPGAKEVFVLNRRRARVLVASDSQDRMAAVFVSRENPELHDLHQAVAPLVGPKTVLHAHRQWFSPWPTLCKVLGIGHVPERDWNADPQVRLVRRYWRWVGTWLSKFNGVSLRYINHYLAWFRFDAAEARGGPILAAGRNALNRGQSPAVLRRFLAKVRRFPRGRCRTPGTCLPEDDSHRG